MAAWPGAPSSMLEKRLMSLGDKMGPKMGNGQLSGEDAACTVFRSLVATGPSPSPGDGGLLQWPGFKGLSLP